MKKSLVIFVLLAFSFIGYAKESNKIQEKTYYFEYEEIDMFSLPTGNFLWYRIVDLYIDNIYVETMNLTNRRDMIIAYGFSVPVGSRWELRTVREGATKDGWDYILTMYCKSYDQATDTSDEPIKVQVVNHQPN